MVGDWYSVHQIAPGLWAIGEPRYEQQNWSYLIEGAERALLFDTGSWFGNIAPVVAGLTDKPLTVLPSHMHFDHLGNVHRFENIHLPDLPVLRACEDAGHVTPTEALFLGSHEGHAAPRFAVAEWLPIGSKIDLGAVTLKLLHTPGHSPDSVSLWWEDADILMAADFLYHGPLYAQVPGASLADYLSTARKLRDRLGPNTVIFGAHGDADTPETATSPQLAVVHLEALITTLEDLRRNPSTLAGDDQEVPVCELNTLIVGVEALKGFSGHVAEP